MTKMKSLIVLWDDCLELEAYIRSNTSMDIFYMDSMTPETKTSEETFLGLLQCYPNILITRYLLATKSLVVSIGVFKVFTLNISPKNILPPA